MKKYFIMTITFLCILAGYSAQASNITLYDAHLNDELPDEQSEYLYRGVHSPSGIVAYYDYYTRFNTTGHDDQLLSYATQNIDFDRRLGVTINFRVRILNEMYAVSYRGPFNITFFSEDQKGVMLWFRPGQILQTNNSVLSALTSVNYTTTSFVDYSLSVIDDSYVLSANGIDILSGNLTYFPRTEKISFGDATETTGGIIDLESVSLQGDGVRSLMSPTVPEPMTSILFLCSLAGIATRKLSCR